jgi:hypothetical protein
MIIVEKFFLQHVPHHKDNVEYWVIELFWSCCKHNDLLYMIFHIHSLFPNGDNPEQVKKPLEHTEAIRDAVFLQANALSHAIEYPNMLEAGLKCITRKSLVACHHKRIIFCLLALVHVTGYEPS